MPLHIRETKNYWCDINGKKLSSHSLKGIVTLVNENSDLELPYSTVSNKSSSTKRKRSNGNIICRGLTIHVETENKIKLVRNPKYKHLFHLHTKGDPLLRMPVTHGLRVWRDY